MTWKRSEKTSSAGEISSRNSMDDWTSLNRVSKKHEYAIVSIT